MVKTSNGGRGALAACALALAASILILVPTASLAVPDAPPVVIDDFNDGDTADWGFFGGNLAGGGGGPFSDRPYEGGFYLSTGWGGEGSTSVFYGGAFKNFPEADQVAPPTDPWFNVWVLNQSDATVDQYTLEITIREDLDGNGWTDGFEDSFRLDTSFTSADFDDEWALVSAPLSAFADQFTGGDGAFNGNLDEVVIVISGVAGGPGSTVEVDFDQLAFSSGGPLAFDEVVFDDMEHGNPSGSGWFTFTGGAGGGIGPNAVDLPPANGGLFSLETGWGSGGTPGFFGGFGRTNSVDISGTDHFNFWINPEAGQDYTLEINLQEDDNSDGVITPPDDDEFQFNCIVSAAGPCALAGGGWQVVSIPLDDFFDDNSFLTGGNGVLDPTANADRGGNGELINVVIAIISNSGADVIFRTDYWAFTRGPLVPDFRRLVDDFESGVTPGTPCAPGAAPLNFCTFNGAASAVALVNPATPPAPVLPAVGTPNSVLQMDVDVTSFAGFIRGFDSGGEWVSQDWSTSEGFSLWLHGTGSGADLFIDILENRNPGSTTDDAQRWTVTFADDFVGWQELQFPFSSFVPKAIGNNAPNDNFDRFEVHGWALGALNTAGPRTYYVDEVTLYGEAAPPALAVGFTLTDTPIEEGTTGNVAVKLNRPFGPDDPAQVSVDFATEIAGATAGEEYTPTSGTLTFTDGGPTELSFPLETFDDKKFEGDERIVLRLSNPVDVELPVLGAQARAVIVDNDPYDPLLVDDFEQGAFQWDTTGPVELDAVRVDDSDPGARPGQDAFENVLGATVPLHVDIAVEGRVCNARSDGVVAVQLLSSADFDATTVDHTSIVFGTATEAHVDKRTGEARRHIEDVNSDGLDDLVFHFRRADIDAGCDPAAVPFNGFTYGGQPITGGGSAAAFGRDFAIGEDWTDTESLSFWYHGSGGGEPVTVTLKDNRAPDPGPAGWSLVWSDEFDEPAGAPANPENWTHEIGDGALNGIEGWGNSELQYYTDGGANAATDGNGNLVITLEEADGTQECFYGTCEYTSSRLISLDRAEFAYGRIESRLRVPEAMGDGRGLWPAFWSLGADIDRTPWPAAGEIDFMEWVGRLPNEIFGTIHGPGYSGGNSFGGIYDFGEPVFNGFHTFTVEWEPDLIVWYVDGIEYHRAEPGNVAGPWVFNKPFYLLLNFAVGGNFGGPIGDGVVFPQEYLVDYVRVYQGPDTAERFETSFTDDFVGWQEVTIPLSDFTRSAEQPDGAPDDGLSLNDVWGYGLSLPAGNATGRAQFDLVRRIAIPPPTELTVTTLADDGAGSLREALGRIADGGTIDLDPALAGGTIELTSGQLVVDRSVTIDGPATPVVVSGGGASRVFQIEATATVSMNDLVVSDGAAAPQGGGILNYGTLNLDRVVVRDNTENSAGPANFEFGGGGIYNGADSTLNLTDSTVADNVSLNQPAGGIYGFFGSTINITRSTVSGNVAAADVAGGLRTLGDVNIVNSTFSGNVSTAWHGGAIFHTDGQLTVTNSTFFGNSAPGGTAAGIVVATFGGGTPNLTLTDTVLADPVGGVNCAIENQGGAGTITSGGHNIDDDGTCNLTAAGDQPNTDPLLGPLADNGGPTYTHALAAGSPALDAAGAGACPATDQRGVVRPQGSGCDVGAFERE